MYNSICVAYIWAARSLEYGQYMDIWATEPAGAVVLFSDFAVENPKNTTSSRKIGEKSAEFDPFRDILNVFYILELIYAILKRF